MAKTKMTQSNWKQGDRLEVVQEFDDDSLTPVSVGIKGVVTKVSKTGTLKLRLEGYDDEMKLTNGQYNCIKRIVDKPAMPARQPQAKPPPPRILTWPTSRPPPPAKVTQPNMPDTLQAPAPRPPTQRPPPLAPPNFTEGDRAYVWREIRAGRGTSKDDSGKVQTSEVRRISPGTYGYIVAILPGKGLVLSTDDGDEFGIEETNFNALRRETTGGKEQIFSTFESKRLATQSCPKDHALKWMRVRVLLSVRNSVAGLKRTAEDHRCNVCGRDIKAARHVFHCKECDYDVCQECYAPDEPEKIQRFEVVSPVGIALRRSRQVDDRVGTVQGPQQGVLVQAVQVFPDWIQIKGGLWLPRYKGDEVLLEPYKPTSIYKEQLPKNVVLEQSLLYTQPSLLTATQETEPSTMQFSFITDTVRTASRSALAVEEGYVTVERPIPVEKRKQKDSRPKSPGTRSRKSKSKRAKMKRKASRSYKKATTKMG